MTTIFLNGMALYCPIPVCCWSDSIPSFEVHPTSIGIDRTISSQINEYSSSIDSDKGILRKDDPLIWVYYWYCDNLIEYSIIRDETKWILNFLHFLFFTLPFEAENRRSGKEHSSRNSVISKDSMSHNLWFIWWKRRREMKEARQQGTLPLKKIRNILIVRIHARVILY